MKLLLIISFILFCGSAFSAALLKVGKTKVLISNEGESFKKGEILKVRNKKNKLVAKLKVLKTSKSKTLAKITKKSKTRPLKKGMLVLGIQKKSIKKEINSKKEVKEDLSYKVNNLELRIFEDQIGNFSVSYARKWKDKNIALGGLATVVSQGASGSINSQTGFSIGIIGDYGMSDYMNSNGLYMRGSLELTSLSVEFEDSATSKVYAAELLGPVVTGSIAYRYHLGKFNLNGGAGLRYSTISSSVTSSDKAITADGVYGGFGVKIFLSGGMRF